MRAGVVARQTGQRILGVVENMGPLVLQDGSAIALFGQGGADAVAHELSIGQDKAVEVLARIPLSLGLREGGDQGTPIVLSHPADPAALAINELARVIAHSGPSRAGINLGISPV